MSPIDLTDQEGSGLQLSEVLVQSLGPFQVHLGSCQEKRSCRPMSTRGLPEAASQGQGAPQSHKQSRWSCLKRNTTTFEEGRSHPTWTEARIRPPGNVVSQYLSWTHSLTGWSLGCPQGTPMPLAGASLGYSWRPSHPGAHSSSEGWTQGLWSRVWREEIETGEPTWPALIPGISCASQ